MIITFSLLLKDRDGDVSRTRISYDIDTSATIAALVSYLNEYGGAVQSLSDAQIISGRIELPKIREGIGEPESTSSVYRSLVLFSLSNSGRAGHIQIPSARLTYADTTGDYAGFRVLEQIGAVETALGFYGNPTFILVDEAGLPIGDSLEVGCFRLE